MKDRSKKRRINNWGFSLVEIVCAIAIFSLVIGAIGSIMMYTAKSYTRSSQEAELQQEAQFAVERIGGIIQDATNVTYTTGVLTMEDDLNTHKVSYNAGTSQLVYRHEKKDGSADTGEQLLASNITEFTADTSDFDKTKTVSLNLTVKDQGGEYKMSYSMKARNEAATLSTGTVVPAVSLIVGNKFVVVPGQTFTFPVKVNGSDQGITATSSGATVLVPDKEHVTVTIPKEAAKTGNSVIYVDVATKELQPSGLPMRQAQVEIRIRRVNELKVNHELVAGSAEEGKAGAEYKFTSHITNSTPYLEKVLGVDWEIGYENPRAVAWSHKFYMNGTESSAFDTYFNRKNVKENEDIPSVTYELKQDLPAGAELVVIAKSKHADGVNKALSDYDDVEAQDILKSEAPAVSGGTNVVVMEPNQTAEIPVTISGAGAIDCDLTGNDDGSTSATYADGKVKIKLGKNEKDTVKVSVHPSGDTTNKFDITVNVRRVESISINCAKESGTDLSAGAVYNFTTSYAGTNLNKASDSQEVSAYMNAYITEFSWEYKVGTAVRAKGTVVHNNYNESSDVAYTGAQSDQFIEIVSMGTDTYNPYIRVKLKKDFDKNAEFTMTAKALHPLGKDATTNFNKTGNSYATGIEDSCKLQKGGLMATTNDGLVIAEPGQGEDKDILGAFAIPIYLKSSISGIEAQLTGNKSSATSLWAATTGAGHGHRLDNTNTWYIKMKIGSDETGTNGKMTLKLSAKDSSGTVLDTEEITIGLRRVTDVEIVSDGDINNKVGATIKLTAEATGYGKDGTEYFEQYTETDEGGNQPVWDKNYVSPYPMEWTVVTNGTEKPLATYATVLNTTYDAAKNQKENRGKHEIEFTLASALPNGSKIRATSRHAGGENKSGKAYEDVYGEIEVKGGSSQPQYAKAPFERGEDYLFNKNTGDLKQYVKKEIEPKYFMRIHDHKTGEKTAYLKSGEDGNQMKIGVKESGALLPDRGYTIEYILVVADMDKKILYYPKDEAIRETGSGFDEFTYVDTGLSDSYEYRWFYDLDKATPVFDMGDGKYVSNKGSKDSPIEIKDDSTVTIDDVVGINVGITNSNPDANGDEFKNNVYPKLFQKWENGTWVTIEDVTIAMEKSGSSKMLNNQNNPYNWYMGQRDNRIFHFRVDNNKTKTPGIYRVGVGIKNAPTRFSKISGKLWDKTTTEITEDLEWSLYDEANDTGFIYIEIK